jgi:Holliday junction resolvase RusA-like endonuclease
MVRMIIPFFPPSTNKAYFFHSGRMHLSSAGKQFKNNVTSHLLQKYPKELQFFKKNSPYLIYLRLYMKDVENAGWPKKCETRYKIFDGTNRIKLLEDALKTATGIDDSHHIAFLVEKRVSADRAVVEVFAWNLETEVTPLDAFTRL